MQPQQQPEVTIQPPAPVQQSVQYQVLAYKGNVVLAFNIETKGIVVTPNGARQLALELRRFAARIDQEQNTKKKNKKG